MQARIALLEDDELQSQLVSHWLEDAGFLVHQFSTGEALLRRVTHDNFDLFLIDWELPDIKGIEVIQKLRGIFHIKSPVIITTIRSSEEDIVNGLTQGADDYLAKPLRHAEFIARVNAALRRCQQHEDIKESSLFPPYQFDPTQESVSLEGKHIKLTNKEFQIALLLFHNSGSVMSRSYLLEKIWGQRADINTRTVDSHISSVRQKLNINDQHGWQLKSIYGYGYRLENVSSA